MHPETWLEPFWIEWRATLRHRLADKTLAFQQTASFEQIAQCLGEDFASLNMQAKVCIVRDWRMHLIRH